MSQVNDFLKDYDIPKKGTIKEEINLDEPNLFNDSKKESGYIPFEETNKTSDFQAFEDSINKASESQKNEPPKTESQESNNSEFVEPEYLDSFDFKEEAEMMTELGDILIPIILTIIFHVLLKKKSDKKDFELRQSEKNKIIKLLTKYLEAKKKTFLTPEWALVIGIISIYGEKAAKVYFDDDNNIKPKD